MPTLRVNDLLPESRLERIETQVRSEFPRIPENAIFCTYVQPEEFVQHNGVEMPVPSQAVVAIMVPNPRWPAKEPQYQVVRGTRWLHHFRHFEQQRDRLVDAPDVALMDFRACAKKAVEVATYYKDLLN